MGISTMAHNGSGWERIGQLDHENIGDSVAKGYSVQCGPRGIVSFEVGTQVDAHSIAEKRAVNKGLLAAGWVAHTSTNCLTHPSGASIQVTRNFWVDPLTRVRARYTRNA